MQFIIRHSVLILLAILITGMATGNEKTGAIPVLQMNKRVLAQWKQHEFEGQTAYQLIRIDDRAALRAVCRGTASAFYREMEVNIRKTPYLTWSWKVTEATANPDEKQKSGDDFAARVYVVVKTGIFPWQVIAFNYVWSMDDNATREWASPYSDKVIMKAMNQGSTGLGQWYTHKVNVLEDLKAAFGKEIPVIHGIAVMTDMDNTGNSATAFYGEITFSER